MSAPKVRAAEDLAGRPVTIMGLGLFGGGVAAARFFTRLGARVCVTDLRTAEELAPSLGELQGLDVRWVLGRHRMGDFTDSALIVANPAVPPTSRFLAAARAADVPITSELELSLDRARARLVLVTGTNGKSSTCHFLAQLLASEPADGDRGRVYLGGNIGAPLLELADGMRAQDVAVVEVSSYQLQALTRAEPRQRVAVVAVTNVSADHLERHGSPEDYFAAKARICDLAGEGAAAFLPAGDERFAPLASAMSARGCDVIRFGAEASPFEDVDAAREFPLQGAFQAENLHLALGIARRLGANPRTLASRAHGITGLPHRLEELGQWSGIRVVDNGVSTTPDSTLAALEALGGPCTLVCGGQLKRGLDLAPLAQRVAGSGSLAITFGAGATELARAFRTAGAETRSAPSLPAAVELALHETPVGGTLLFSPAAASFDSFSNFRARALAFRDALQRSPLTLDQP